MAWMCLALRKQSLKSSVNELTYEDIQLSRKVRGVHRKLSHEKASYNAAKKSELRDIKAAYMEVRNARPGDIKSDEYQQWQVEYAAAQEDYQAAKQDIEEYYDDINEEIETEAQDEEDALQEEITETESQRDAQNAELQTITDQVKTEIEGAAIKF